MTDGRMPDQAADHGIADQSTDIVTQVRKLEPFSEQLSIDGVEVAVAGLHRPGRGDRKPIVFLHGFGSTKEDYTDVIQSEALGEHPVIAYDAPGCGQTGCSDLRAVSIPFLVAVATAVLERRGVDRFHLVGHSMGGLTSLLLAETNPDRVLSFVDIEGNLAPEDCFLSRQILTYSEDDPAVFLDRFTERAATSRFYASSLYSASLHYKARAGVVRAIFESMVDLSDTGDLLTRFLGLPMPRQFMYGEQNRTLSYLPTLTHHGVELAEIGHSGHFPMYSNPPQMWHRIASFIRIAERHSGRPGADA